MRLLSWLCKLSDLKLLLIDFFQLQHVLVDFNQTEVTRDEARVVRTISTDHKKIPSKGLVRSLQFKHCVLLILMLLKNQKENSCGVAQSHWVLCFFHADPCKARHK